MLLCDVLSPLHHPLSDVFLCDVLLCDGIVSHFCLSVTRKIASQLPLINSFVHENRYSRRKFGSQTSDNMDR